MAASEFRPGQRWISNTEAELGLGIVVEATARRVEIQFPAADEVRTYALENAPVSRVIYPVGESVQSVDGASLKVVERMENNGVWLYMTETEEGESRILPESELAASAQFSRPQDRLFAGQIDKNRAFRLRVETLEHQHRLQQNRGHGLMGPRVQLLPHQFYIADQVGKRQAPRVLLADEVGLGKTIEAGLILHQQIISERARRVLVVVPDSLVYQWLVEMLRRFNLTFSVMDELRCMTWEMGNDGNPLESAQLVLCSQSFLTGSEQRLQQALDVEWDLMIVDEAHHLGWSEEAPSHAYLTIEQLARHIPGVLLLTATPEQLGLESHFARLRLLDPDRYYDLEAFRKEEAGYLKVSGLVSDLVAEGADLALMDKTSPLSQALIGYLGEDAWEGQQQQLALEAEPAIEHFLDQLIDRHGTGRALFRNTRDGVDGFMTRHLNMHPLPAPAAFSRLAEDAALSDQLRPEKVLGDNWLVEDPRVQWLQDWLKARRTEKALLICHDAKTANLLEEFIRLRSGVRSAVFHEGMTLINRDRAAAYFADTEEYAQVLVCSEIGSEGRNFQFAQHLIMFDLPLNPDLLEQRIGRLDRIGQRHDIQIHVPYYEGSAQQRLLEWYHDGINAFEQTCPAGQALYQRFAEPLHDALLGKADIDAVDDLLDETAIAAEETRQTLQQGRNRLLEMSSCRPMRVEPLLADIDEEGNPLAISGYMDKVFDHFGVDTTAHDATSVIVRPGDHMLVEAFPGLPEDGFTGTWQRNEALSREDIQFFNWEHPMVAGAMEMILGNEYGNATVSSIKLPLPPGTLLLEGIFRLHCAAPKAAQIGRFIPQASTRVVVDVTGNNLTEVLTSAHLNKLCERLPKRTAQQLVQQAREQIDQMVTRLEKTAAPQEAAMLTEARERCMADQSGEVERLQALAEINPAITETEVNEQIAQRDQLLGYLDNGKLVLDAIRLVIVTD
ncbi:MAG: RNA polymerase-associated protein RapA [Marinobacterium sp.]|nr:RNA polymerase-associated protein RapA [Marinobacterium sp.]